MKTYTIQFTLRQVISLVFGFVVAISIFAFTGMEDNAQITLEQAQSLYSRNQQASTPFGGNLKGVAISNDMLTSLNNVNNNVQGEFGYRCYFGMDENNNPVSIIIAIDDRNADLVTYIETGEATLFSGCPTACDLASPITNP